ncbi:MAG: 16S rRNA (uracil(1498)-N(3))-methyltransferase [Rhodospirillales bacterium]|nr:16S rRNA (uracil(1498)-N(3))-methyltransferase [Rhodospirillales bacterium]
MAEHGPATAETRLYVDDTLATGTTVGLGPERAHFLKHVLRLGSGAAVSLFNGRDGEFLARIDAVGKNAAALTVEAQIRPPAAEVDLWLVFAPIKFGRIDFLAQKATELGVSRLMPVFTRYTSVDRVNVERLAANAVEAAEQTQRLTVPLVAEATSLDRAIGDWPRDRRLYVCAEFGTVQPAATAFAAHGRGAPAGILVGPEGGFERSELDALTKLSFVTAVGLGPRVLRADTAALAALAVWQAVAGDWIDSKPAK